MKKKKGCMCHDECGMDMMDAEMEDMPMKTECMEEQEDMCGMVLAHSYVPWQYYTKAFCPREALMKGTLFPELYGVYPIPR